MRAAKKYGPGGKHVAIERGLWQTWRGSPFGRELREITVSSFTGRRRTPPPAIPSATSEVKPCQA